VENKLLRYLNHLNLACRYRLNVEKLDWNIYVTDVGQWQHVDMLFKVCPNWPRYCQCYTATNIAM